MQQRQQAKEDKALRHKKRRFVSALMAFLMAFKVTAYATVSMTGPGVQETAAASDATAATGTATSGTGTSTVAEPTIQSEGAVVMDAATGTVLYGKNQNTRYYPASITKLMTALLVLENCQLGDTVTFSKTATENLEAGAVSLKLTEGDKLTVEQCLYGLLLKSANEVANGLAEKVSGSVSGFASLMNQKAAALGCTGTHFVNPNGLNDTNHYTTPYDMALIARAAFQNDTLRKIDTTLSYKFPATKNAGERTITMGHKMMYSTDSRYYPGIIGGKTGYTSKAGNTLVTGAEKNGVRLIAVVMKSKSTHYADTKALLDYGFAKMAASGSSGTSQNGSQSSNTQGPGETTGNNGGTQEPGTTTSPAQPVTPAQKKGWNQDNTGWYYIKDDNTKASGEWLRLSDATYWIDSNGYMATGWRQYNNGAWYYFKSSGAMAKNTWIEDNNKWFYLGGEGYMLKDTTVDGRYRLNSEGVWVQ